MFSARLSDLEHAFYDQAVQIENLELRVDSGCQELHQQVDKRFQQVDNEKDSMFNWLRRHLVFLRCWFMLLIIFDLPWVIWFM